MAFLFTKMCNKLKTIQLNEADRLYYKSICTSISSAERVDKNHEGDNGELE